MMYEVILQVTGPADSQGQAEHRARRLAAYMIEETALPVEVVEVRPAPPKPPVGRWLPLPEA